MYGRFPTCVSVLLIAVLPVIAACNGGGITPTTPSAVTTLKAFTAEPLVATPQFLQSSSCLTDQPFGIRTTVIVGGSDLIVRGFQFEFTDRFGRVTRPDVFPALPGFNSLPSGPVPFPPGVSTIPNSSPIPIPGSPPVHGVLLNNTSFSLPVFLRFGCGVFPDGTIFVTGDLTDRNGRPETPKLRIAVKRT